MVQSFEEMETTNEVCDNENVAFESSCSMLISTTWIPCSSPVISPVQRTHSRPRHLVWML